VCTALEAGGEVERMNGSQDLDAIAREILDSNLYMTLGTADGDGRPWVSPVYYAAEEYQEFHWVSSPEATHSRNLATLPQISIVVFNSQTPIGTGQAVYMSAEAQELTGVELDRGIALFSRRSQASGAAEWKKDDVLAPALLRLYRATATDHLGTRSCRQSQPPDAGDSLDPDEPEHLKGVVRVYGE
jgi:nitroimidazol reductase NimA-like FMN-containing flavoprotein (pyridoxamine 5'-phosphate oxidase superfamily)